MQSRSTDGANLRTLASDTRLPSLDADPWGIAVFQGYIYLSDREHESIARLQDSEGSPMTYQEIQFPRLGQTHRLITRRGSRGTGVLCTNSKCGFVTSD